MFIPISDTPNPRSLPLVNIILIGINVAVFLLVTLPLSAQRPDPTDPLLYEYLHQIGAYSPRSISEALRQLTAYDLFVFRHGFRPAEPAAAALLSSMFLHGGWMHLGGNMLFLWIFGDNIEHRLGHLGYLFAYLAAGITATLFYAVFVIGSPVPLIGASGAISGVLGAYYLWFPRNRVKTFIFLFPFIMTTVMIPARFVLGFYLLVDNLLPFLWNGAGGGGGVAHGAHIGGFVAGLGLAWGIDTRSDYNRRHARRNRVETTDSAPLQVDAGEIARQVSRGNLRWAAGLYFALKSRAERSDVAARDVLAIGNYFLDHGDADAALSVFRRFIADRQTAPELGQAYLGAGKALSLKSRCSTAAYQYFLNAIDCANDPAIIAEARSELDRIDSSCERLS